MERILDVCHSVDSESGEQQPCNNPHTGRFKWEVRGHVLGTTNEERQTFCYRAPHVVLATGVFGMPNRLCVPGEGHSYVLHSLQDLDSLIGSGKLNSKSDPLLVVGAGLSAADAVLYARSLNIPVVHVFRRAAVDPGLVFRKLPTKLYPEYHEVYQMMQSSAPLEGYTSYAGHNIVEFLPDYRVMLRCLKTNRDTILDISCALVLIGSRPDLSFLPHAGTKLGLVPGVQIDSVHNPIDIDPYTYQSRRACGLFAMGPLVGDNFVRFLQGGALGIVSHLWRKRNYKL